jgi:hypothetical protein
VVATFLTMLFQETIGGDPLTESAVYLIQRCFQPFYDREFAIYRMTEKELLKQLQSGT